MFEFVDKDVRKTLGLSLECLWKPNGCYCIFLWRQDPACQLDPHCHVVYFPSDLWHSLNCVLALVRNEPTIWQSQCPSLNHNRPVLRFSEPGLGWLGKNGKMCVTGRSGRKNHFQYKWLYDNVTIYTANRLQISRNYLNKVSLLLIFTRVDFGAFNVAIQPLNTEESYNQCLGPSTWFL